MPLRIIFRAAFAALAGLCAAMPAHAQSYSEGNFYVGETPYQMYVEYRFPAKPVHDTPIILIHGASHTGAGYVQTPDGRDGWAILLVRAGWKVYTVDWPGHGRSPMPADFPAMSMQKVIDAGDALIKKIGTRVVLLTHSMSGPIGWKLAEANPDKVVAIVGVAPGGPGNDMPPPDAKTLALLGPITGQARRAPKEYARKLFGNSEMFPKEAFDNYYASLVPESERIASERFNRDNLGRVIDVDLKKLTMPIMVMTGDQDTLHPKADDEKLAKQLKADFMYLPDLGLPGHGHMQMLERGNEKIAAVFMEWLGKHGL